MTTVAAPDHGQGYVDTGPRHASRFRYHPALDGLRAVAVLAVLAFHGGMPWARGGFLGVDAFFVLSGYLITGLLLAEWEQYGRIDLRAFWVRRARRLLPALLVPVHWAVYVAVVCVGRGLSSYFTGGSWSRGGESGSVVVASGDEPRPSA